MRIDTEVFFRPEEIVRETSSIRADLYSHCRKALKRSITDCAFVPVRAMQLQAVITQAEIVFVDNLNYAVQDGRGGRLIMLGWDLARANRRASLDGPVSIEIVYFHADTRELHDRLMSEFPPALASQEKYARGDPERQASAEIIRLRHV